MIGLLMTSRFCEFRAKAPAQAGQDDFCGQKSILLHAGACRKQAFKPYVGFI
jgi:hypothetical protein